MQLTADFEHAIDERLRAGDPVASSDLAEACYQPLVRWLRRAFPQVDDPAFYFDAATEAILNYAERPAIFDPSRNSLSGFLRMSAAADLRNCLSRQRRVRNYEVPVETSDDDGNTNSEEPFRPFEWKDEEELLIRQIDGARLVDDFLATVPAEDGAAVRLLLGGERGPDEYLYALQLQDLHQQVSQIASHFELDYWSLRRLLEELALEPGQRQMHWQTEKFFDQPAQGSRAAQAAEEFIGTFGKSDATSGQDFLEDVVPQQSSRQAHLGETPATQQAHARTGFTAPKAAVPQKSWLKRLFEVVRNFFSRK